MGKTKKSQPFGWDFLVLPILNAVSITVQYYKNP